MELIAPGTQAAMTDSVRAGFTRHYGADPTVIGRAPGRVNLIGEHTDYNGGVCLPLALPHSTWAALRPRTDGQVRMSSGMTADPDEVWSSPMAEIRPGNVPGWPAYVAGVLWALAEDGLPIGGADLHIESTVPLGSGLSSSAALECAVAVAALAALDQPLDDALRRRVIAACIRAEGEMAEAPTGGMDQSIAMLAEPASALLIDFAEHTTTPIPIGAAADPAQFWVVDTRVQHALTDGGYGDRRAECDAAAAAMGLTSLHLADAASIAALADPLLRSRARHVHTEIGRVHAAVAALQAGQWTELGRLFGLSHASMRDDFEISCPELDLAVDTATRSGAYGARMTGGGFGGSAVLLVAPDQAEAVADAITEAFAAAGYAAPGFLHAIPGRRAGAD